jgi:hypothetical protein
MTSAAERKRRQAASTAAKAEQNRQARARNAVDGDGAPVVNTAAPRERTGLEWLLHKKRITARQFWAGTEYGNLYRSVARNGEEPLRSCIGDHAGGAGSTGDAGKVPGMSFADNDLDAQQRLTACHVSALSSEANMIATCAAVCGRQLTPREITAEHTETVEIETTLRLALNLLADHLERRKEAA